MNHQPVPLTPEKLKALHPSTETQLYLGGIWGSVESGQTWLATDGRRTVISADSAIVIYVLTGGTNSALRNGIFAQSAQGFRGEVTTYPLIEGARRAEPVVKLAEFEANVILGAFSVTSGGALALVLGMDVLSFCASNKDGFPRWSRAIAACLTTREVLKRHAPTLYDKLIDALLISVKTTLKESLPSVPEAGAKDSKLVARLLGTLLGKIGKQAATGRIRALGVIWILLSSLAAKIPGAVPGAVKIAFTDDREKTAQSIVHELRRAGVTLSAEDARKIVAEVSARPQQLRQSLEQLRRAFEGIRAE